ncbi:MAG: hypothetical protein LC650_05400, partial [Actinobacteria bacterium]|nr:hypothetical protein [Actinomycetota bacterium]
MRSNGDYDIQLYEANSMTNSPLATASGVAAAATYTVRFILDGSSQSLYIDDVLLGSWTNATYSTETLVYV